MMHRNVVQTLLLLGLQTQAAGNSIDTSNHTAFKGVLNFHANATCSQVYNATKAKIAVALELEDYGLHVDFPSVVDETVDFSDVDACFADAESHETEWSSTFTAMGFKEIYGGEDDVADKVKAKLGADFSLDVPGFGALGAHPVVQQVEFIPFEIIKGELQVSAKVGCDEVLTGLRTSMARVCGLAPIFVHVSHVCTKDDEIFPGDGEDKVEFTVSATVKVASMDEADQKAHDVEKLLNDNLQAEFVKELKTLENEDLVSSVELKALSVTDYQPGDQEQPLTKEEVTGRVTYKGEASCVKMKIAVDAALIEVLNLEEDALSVSMPGFCTSIDSTGDEWSIAFTVTHLAKETPDLKERIDTVLATEFTPTLKKKLGAETADNSGEVSAEVDSVEDIPDDASDSENNDNEDAEQETGPQQPVNSKKMFFQKDQLMSAIKGNVTFSAAATCDQSEFAAKHALREALLVMEDAVWVAADRKSCDDSSGNKELGTKTVNFKAVIPESEYGVSDLTKVKKRLDNGMPTYMESFLKNKEASVAESFSDTVKLHIEHVQIELLKVKAEITAKASCEEVQKATARTVESVLKLDRIYVNVRKPCDGDFEGSPIEINVTLPAKTENIDSEIYRAAHVNKALKAEFESSFKGSLKKYSKNDNTAFQFKAAEVEGFTSPEVDNFGDQSEVRDDADESPDSAQADGDDSDGSPGGRPVWLVAVVAGVSLFVVAGLVYFACGSSGGAPAGGAYSRDVEMGGRPARV